MPSALKDGRYEIRELVGHGGMGAVWAGLDRELDREIAIKVLNDQLSGDPDSRTRFQNEIKTAAKLQHPRIVQVHDWGYEDGRLFVVMQLVDGPDLGKLCGQMEPARALNLFGQVAQAVQEVHDRGYIHRDVKPANVLVGKSGQPGEYAMLTDFGVARALQAPGGLTIGLPPGTPRYMAPEIWTEHAAGQRSDQYALACVLLEMLTGIPPFDGGSFTEIKHLHCSAPPPPLGALMPEAPDELGRALARALSKDPASRFPTVFAFAEAVLAARFPDEPSVEVEPQRLQLSPSRASIALFGLAPDRDERAPQLAMETLLTLWANSYGAPAGAARSFRAPKRRNGALRSLALGTNFLEGLDEPRREHGHSPSWLGEALARGTDFANSANLGLAQRALRALLDPQTEQGSAGASLMLPIHESLLWFDARKSGAVGARWAVRKVNMRGTGITLGRMLLDPPDAASGAAADAAKAVAGIREALTADSPFAALAAKLDAYAPEEVGRDPEPAETSAWKAADDGRLSGLAERLARHAKNIVGQPNASPAARLINLRSILALDLAHHLLERSWDENETLGEQRFLVLSYAPEERRSNRVRIASEAAYQAARQSLVQALIATIGRRAAEIALLPEPDFDAQFESRSGLAPVAQAMAKANPADAAAFASLAGLAYEDARGAGYGRAVEGFRVLLESLGLLMGTGAYRWLRANPQLLSAMIGAATDGPVELPELLRRLRAEWGLVIGEAEAVGTDLERVLDGGLLSRNARHLERLLVASGLAQALSDQTCIVGQRIGDAS